MLLALSLSGANGCSSSPTASAQNHDPLVGIMSPPSLPQPNSAPKTSSSSTTQNAPVQPPGTELTSTNNATLAGMSGTLGRPLAIDNQGRALPSGQLTSGSWTGPAQVQPGYLPYNANPKVERVPDAEPTTARSAPSSWQGTPPANANVQPASTAPAPSLADSLKRQLQERGVVNQKVEPIPGGVHLYCYFPVDSTGRMPIRETTAPDYETAALAILDQLNGKR